MDQASIIRHACRVAELEAKYAPMLLNDRRRARIVGAMSDTELINYAGIGGPITPEQADRVRAMLAMELTGRLTAGDRAK